MSVLFKTDQLHGCKNVFFLNLNYGERQNVGQEEMKQNKHFHSFFCCYCCFVLNLSLPALVWVKMALKHTEVNSVISCLKTPSPPLALLWVEFKKKWGKKRKGKNSRPHCSSRPMRIAEPQQEKEEEEKEGKRERYFHPAPPMKWRVWGGGEENRVDATSAFAFSSPSHMLSQTPFVYQSRVSVKSNIVLRWFWSSPEPFNTLWFVRWKRDFTRILSQFSHKVCGWKGRFVFESWTLVISLLLKCHLLISFYYLLVLCCLSRI